MIQWISNETINVTKNLYVYQEIILMIKERYVFGTKCHSDFSQSSKGIDNKTVKRFVQICSLLSNTQFIRK